MSMIGHVTEERYAELVAQDRELVTLMTGAQFTIGDHALEIEPLHHHGGSHAGPGQELFGVEASLQRYAEDIAIPYNSVKNYRWVSARWPKEHRQRDVCHGVHRILADISDESERFTAITQPPVHPRTGRREWTLDGARRVVGERVDHPVSVQEKVQAVHDLARDEEVASQVATDLLRRPDVAFRAMSDSTARHLVNRAQIDRSQQRFEENLTPPAARALHQVRRTGQMLELIGACAAFIAAVGRAMPQLRGHTFDDTEKAALGQQISRVRATTDWLETAVETGNLTLDEALEALLRGE
jgi:hypothetical protein